MGEIILSPLVVIAPAVPLSVPSPTTKGVCIKPPPWLIVIVPLPAPPAVEILAATPFWSVNIPVARKNPSVTTSTLPPLPVELP